MAIVPNDLEENESETVREILQNYKTNLNAEIVPERVQYHNEFFEQKLIFEKTTEDCKFLMHNIIFKTLSDLLLQLNPTYEDFYFHKMRFRHLIELANIQFYVGNASALQYLLIIY